MPLHVLAGHSENFIPSFIFFCNKNVSLSNVNFAATHEKDEYTSRCVECDDSDVITLTLPDVLRLRPLTCEPRSGVSSPSLPLPLPPPSPLPRGAVAVRRQVASRRTLAKPSVAADNVSIRDAGRPSGSLHLPPPTAPRLSARSHYKRRVF